MNGRKRYVQVGLGGRHAMFRDAVVKGYSEHCELVGLCDKNEGRLRLSVGQVRDEFGVEVPGYLSDDFDRMIDERKPHCVIVTTMDSTHDLYICRAMEKGCDVICEKPMTIDETRCRRILDTQKRTGRSLRVSFNYRYAPPRTQIKDLLMKGVIGDVLSVDFHWMLDMSHGVDYFRRWHRNKANSGGLLVHKATHHFDLVNWWLSSVPEIVYAAGHRKYYTPKTADRFGVTNRSDRCLTCKETARCPFYCDLTGKSYPEWLRVILRELYLDCEKYDGYYRDQCVFSESIDIEDAMSLVVSYRNGVKMSYSLIAFSPWEGQLVTFNGSKGRLEFKAVESAYISGDGTVPGILQREGSWLRVFPHFRAEYNVEMWKAVGGHGGGDDPLVADLFSPTPPEDIYKRAADQRAGAWSILTGVAANRSIESGLPIKISDLVPDIETPDYPAMPMGDEPLPLRNPG